MNKDKTQSIRIDPKIYRVIKQIAVEQKRDLKVVLEFAVEAYARASKGWKIK